MGCDPTTGIDDVTGEPCGDYTDVLPVDLGGGDPSGYGDFNVDQNGFCYDPTTGLSCDGDTIVPASACLDGTAVCDGSGNPLPSWGAPDPTTSLGGNRPNTGASGSGGSGFGSVLANVGSLFGGILRGTGIVNPTGTPAPRPVSTTPRPAGSTLAASLGGSSGVLLIAGVIVLFALVAGGKRA